jgi:cell division protein FtsQ
MTIVDARADPSRDEKSDKRPRRWQKPAALAIGVFLLMLAPFWAPLFLRRLVFFRLRHVEVVGARYVNPRDVLDRLKVDTLASVWDPTARLEARVAAHPLVREVVIGRRLPGTLVVRLVEHVPIALVATTGGLKAYDERGVALPIDPTAADVDAPILARPDAALLRLLAAARLSQPVLYRRLSEVRRERSGPGTADNELLFVIDSLPVRTMGDVTLHRLADVELVEQDLARRRVRAIELDLRYRDQVIARLQ